MAKDKRLRPKNLFSFLSYESKLLIFSIFTVTIFACPILNVSITGNELSEDVNWNAPSAEPNDTEWIIREGEFDYSGKLYEEGDEEGGRVCHPDCPSGWDEDEYDLWLINATTGVVTVIAIDDGDDFDGTDLTLEYCTGDVDINGDIVVGILFCKEFADSEQVNTNAALAKKQYKSFYRISPNPSFGNDHVDYTIGWTNTFYDDEGSKQIFGTEKNSQRTHTFSGYVCFSECTSDTQGQDLYDPYRFELLDDEELVINIHSYPDPDRGNMRVWLILPEPINDEPYIDIYFDDEEEWTFYIDTRLGFSTGEYELFIISEPSDGEDGMTYDIELDQIWVSPSRDLYADYDGDGWTDFDESDCGTSPWLIIEIPPDWDSDEICNSIDMDDDGDGVFDGIDSCPFGSTDISLNDTDGDGCKDIEDSCPTDANEWQDTDGDGICNNADVFPWDENEWKDSDGDGIGDNTNEGFNWDFIIFILLLASIIGVIRFRENLMVHSTNMMPRIRENIFQPISRALQLDGVRNITSNNNNNRNLGTGDDSNLTMEELETAVDLNELREIVDQTSRNVNRAIEDIEEDIEEDVEDEDNTVFRKRNRFPI